MHFLLAIGIWFTGTCGLAYLGLNTYTAMIVTYIVMLAIAWDIEKAWDWLWGALPEWPEWSDTQARSPRQKPAAEPAPQTKHEAAVLKIIALKAELGRLPTLDEISAHSDIARTTAWRALKEVKKVA